MIHLTLLALVLSTASGEPATPASPPTIADGALQLPPMPTTVDEALGTARASKLRRAGLSSALTGGLLGLVGVGSLTLALDAQRQLHAEPHTRAQADQLLLQRLVGGVIGWPAAALSACGVGAGVAMLVLDDGPTEGALSATSQLDVGGAS